MIDAFVRTAQRHHVQVTLVGSAFAFENDIPFGVADANFVPKERCTQSTVAQLLDGHEGDAQIL